MQRSIDIADLASTRNGESVSPAPAAETPRASFNILRAVEFVAETVVIVALLAELILVLANIFDRTYFRRSFLWADEAARLSLSILAFIGGAVAPIAVASMLSSVSYTISSRHQSSAPAWSFPTLWSYSS